jgi:hypothetical protein
VTCPNCGSEVDTTSVYAYLEGFPPSFAALKAAYNGFTPKWEFNRQNIDDLLAERFSSKSSTDVETLQTELNTAEGRVWYRQRLFYRSCVAFMRSYQLMLGYLVLDRRCFHTWAIVTGYYARFYFAQAFLNLWLASSFQNARTIAYFDGEGIRYRRRQDVGAPLRDAGSHEVWWSFLEAMKAPTDVPAEGVGFVLSQLGLSLRERNRINYDFGYLGGGFIELDWFDTSLSTFFSHFRPNSRADRDFTDIDRFFDGQSAEEVDVGDFYGDTDVQLLWESVKCYLQVLKALEIQQTFITSEKLVALSEVHLNGDYEKVRAGLEQALAQELDDGYTREKLEDVQDWWLRR